MRLVNRKTQVLGALLASATFLAACGGGDDKASDADAGASGSEVTKITLLLPIASPIVHPVRVAQEAGYYEDADLDVTVEFLEGGGAVASQIIADNGDLGYLPVGSVVEALSQGNTDVRAIFNMIYGSIFTVAVPADSDIKEAADLEGKTVGVTALSSGEIPIVRGIAKSAGLTEQDLNLTPVGEGTALAVRAITEGQVDAFAGAVNDIVALEAQGLDLRFITPDELLELPASGFIGKAGYLEENREAVEALLRATTKAAYWAQVNPDATLAVLKKVTPEQFENATGEKLFEAILPLTWNKSGLMGEQSADSWGAYFDFIGAERPDVALEDIVIDDFVEAANDFDKGEVEQDANDYAP
jgi:ABC-type nitrate/sulfonate/bicarbonate transport system substrate-binding protein